MNVAWKARKWACLLSVVGTAMAEGQSPLPAGEAELPFLTLGTSVFNSTMNRLGLSWLYPDQMPEMRLKLDRPVLDSLSAWAADAQVRGVDFRLPMEGVWVGYETPTEGEEPRATLSIQRRF